ncbi:DEAD DEAH box helicase, partial [Coemansia nantahalensis]
MRVLTLLRAPALSVEMLAGPTAAAAAAPAALELRPYQQACIEQSLAALGRGVWRQAVSLPVGSGKTVIFSNLIQRVPAPAAEATKTLVIAHREELLEQAARQIKRASPHLEVHIDQARRVANPAADVVVASVATLGRAGSARLLRHDPARYKCIVIDEAHHAAAESYERILDHFGRRADEQPLLVWGCSATLRRHDGLALSEVFDEIVFQKSFLEMIHEKWLSGLRVTTVRTSCSLSGVPTQAGDFAPSHLSRAVNTKERNGAVVRAHAALAAGRRCTVVFAVDMAHAKSLCRAFVDSGTHAETVLSTTRTADRERILDEFRAGRLPVLVNCGILTEGTDIPTIDCVIMARPTRSTVLFQQMIGRGMRLSPGKKNCLVIDFVDSFKRAASQITIPTLLGLSPSTVLANADVVSAASGATGATVPVDECEPSPQQKLVRSFERHLASLDPSGAMDALKQLGFKAHVHLNPLRFFELGECPDGLNPAAYCRQLDCASSGATWKLREISRYAWVC